MQSVSWAGIDQERDGVLSSLFLLASLVDVFFFMWNRKKQTALETLRDVQKGLTGGELLCLCLIADLIITTYTLFLSNLLHTLFHSCSVLIIY